MGESLTAEQQEGRVSSLWNPLIQCVGAGILSAPIIYACKTLLGLSSRRLYPIFRAYDRDGRMSAVYA
jgi:hypothetical protein